MTHTVKQLPAFRRAAQIMRGGYFSPRKQLLRRMPPRSICAEVGVHKGEFASKILKRTRPVRLHLIDPWTHQTEAQYQESWYGGLGTEGQSIMDERYMQVRAKFEQEISSGTILIHRSSSDEAAVQFPDHYFDWIYIDANHQYDFVKSDLQHFYPKIKVGGFLTGDDYGTIGWWHNGVKRAVDEFVETNQSLILSIVGMQFIIKRGSH